MKKTLAPTAEAINEAHKMAKTAAQNAVQHAIQCGQLLIAMKDKVGHGNFGTWCEENTSFGERTARLYMKAAKVSGEGLAFNSLRSIFPSNAKPKKRESTKTHKAQNGNALPFSNEIPREISPISEKNAPVKAQTSTVKVAPKVSVEHTVPAAPKFDFTDYEPEDDDEYRRSIDNVMMSDDKLAAMRKELQQARIEIASLTAERNHYQAAAGEAVRLLKKRDAEIAKLKKELAKA